MEENVAEKNRSCNKEPIDPVGLDQRLMVIPVIEWLVGTGDRLNVKRC